jgi:tetratricopeptide (TPR) repeat protein
MTMKSRWWLLLLLLGADRLGADEFQQDFARLWREPEFRKHLLGAYGTDAEVEPRVSPEERDLLQKAYDLLAKDTAAATRLVEGATRPDSSARLDFTLGTLYFQTDRLAEAEKRFRLAVAKFPNFRRAHRSLALLHLRNGDQTAAIQAFTRVIELGGTDAMTYGLLGFAYAAREDYLSAESAYRMAALLQPQSADWKIGLTRCVLKQQKFGEAVVLLGDLIEKNPARTEFWLLQANAYVGLKQPLKAAENYEMLARMGKLSPASFNTLGDIYANEGLYDLAAVAYLRGLEQEGGGVSVASALRAAEIFAARGALSQATRILERLQTVPDGSMSDAEQRRWHKLRARVALQDGRGEEAATVLKQIVALDPLDGEALLLLGQHYARNREPERAIFYYERAAGLDAYEATARLRHAQILVGQGKLAEALPLLRRVQELKPQDDVARYLEQVERVARSRRG